MGMTASPNESNVLGVADDLITAFKTLLKRKGEFTARPKLAPLRLVMAYGLAAHAHDVGQDAVRALREGRYGAATPLARVVFECGVKTQWLVLEPEAAQALAAEAHRQRIALADNMARTQQFLHHADKMRAMAGTAPPPAAVSSKNFEKVCAKVDPAGDLYIMYRMLSADSHAGEPVMERWIEEIDQEPWFGWRTTPAEPGSSERNVLAGTVALSLLWAAAGLDQMLKGRPLDRTINTASNKLGYPGGTRRVSRLVLPPR